MATDFDVVLTTTNTAKAVAKALREVERELPFASALALTRQAQESRDVERARARKVFTLRSSYVERGITMRRAEKRDWPKLRAHVGSRDEFMAEQETGAVRRARKKRFAIPTRLIRRTKRGKIPKSKKPRAVLSKPSGYIKGRAIRISAKGRRGKARRLSVAYLLRSKVRIVPRWGFRKSVEATVRANYDGHLERSLRKAFEKPARKLRRNRAR